MTTAYSEYWISTYDLTDLNRMTSRIRYRSNIYEYFNSVIGKNWRSERSVDLGNLGSAAAEQGRSRDPLLHQAGGHLELGSLFSGSGFNGFGKNGLSWAKMDWAIRNFYLIITNRIW
jgi:hypothetical protein